MVASTEGIFSDDELSPVFVDESQPISATANTDIIKKHKISFFILYSFQKRLKQQ
jgi:hypothetical protein